MNHEEENKMNNHDERHQPEDRKLPKYVADEAGRSWLEVLNAARTRSERQREADAQLREAWDLHAND
jgi:hypothetical protein